MNANRKTQPGDAFERAIKETFGEQTSGAKVEQSRQLYARYRTEDMLARLRTAVGGNNDQNPKP